MLELRGKYGEAKVFTDMVDSESIAQVTNLLNQEFVSGCRIRMMPDIHSGAGCTIGTTMEIYDKCCPNLVGVDIGCGMEVLQLSESAIDLEKLDQAIRERVPSGFNKRGREHLFVRFTRLGELVCKDHVNLQNARLSIGTLGGGNHFIEVDQSDTGTLYLVIHSGSRHLGLEVAKHYQNLAVEQIGGRNDDIEAKMIAELKAQGRRAEIPDELKKLRSSTPKIPKELAYLTGQLLEDYLHDMKIVQEYADLNRQAMAAEIMSCLRGVSIVDSFTTIHNYIDTDSMILRKGAVSAKKGERLLIPINMRDGALICVGKGNPDWNCSAPHGAGRLMSRAKAKETFSVEEFAKSMDGIYTTTVGRGTLDECPMAYKPMESILENIGDTVEVEKIIRPIYNFKASE